MKIFRLLGFTLLWACQPPPETIEDRPVRDTSTTAQPVTQLITKGLPKGMVQRDYTLSADGKIAYSTLQLPNFKRSFIIQLDIQHKLPILASFSGKYNDMEPMLAPGDSVLLFASDRPLYPGDSTRDFNLWRVKVKGLKIGTPQAFDTLINTRFDEYYPSMSRKGSLYFTAVYPGRVRDDLYVSTLSDSGYVAPEMLSFCRAEDRYEFNAFVFPGDDTLLFTSGGRPGELGGGDLFFSYRDSSYSWQEPVMLRHQINTTDLDFSPFVRNDTLYFTSKRQDRSWAEKEFKYLSEITSHVDSAAIGTQSIYLSRFRRLLEPNP